MALFGWDTGVESINGVEPGVGNCEFVPAIIIVLTDQTNAICVIPVVRQNGIQLNIAVREGIIQPVCPWNLSSKRGELNSKASVSKRSFNLLINAAGHKAGPRVHIPVKFLSEISGGRRWRYF